MLKHVVVERGKRSHKLLQVKYQAVDTDKYYIWDSKITDKAAMEAIAEICRDAVCTGYYRQRAFYEMDIDESEIMAALAKI